MGKQSARLYYQGNDHRDIFFRGNYHDRMYVGDNLVWEKINDKAYFADVSYIYVTGGLWYSSGVYRLSRNNVSRTPHHPTFLDVEIPAETVLYNKSYSILDNKNHSYTHITSNYTDFQTNLEEVINADIQDIYVLGDDFFIRRYSNNAEILKIKNEGENISISTQEIEIGKTYTVCSSGHGNYIGINKSTNNNTFIHEKDYEIIQINIPDFYYGAIFINYILLT